jgi:hypothetical protein
MTQRGTMKNLLLAVLLVAVAGCAAGPAPGRLAYRESQFANRLEYLRFCMHYEMASGRCE